MPPQDRDDMNPYRATFVDEKPLDAAVFFRAEPQYRKILPKSIGRIGYAMFMQHKWQWIGLGIAQGLFVVCPAVVVIGLLLEYPDMGRLLPWLPVAAGIVLLLLATFMVVVSFSVALRILRKEKMIFRSTPQDAARLIWCMGNTLPFVIAAIAWFLFFVLGVSIGVDFVVQLSEMMPPWRRFFFLLGVGIGFLAAVFGASLLLGRFIYSIPFVVDRRMNGVAAARASWQYTRGQFTRIKSAHDGTNANLFVVLTLYYLTGGAAMAGHLYCTLTVGYLMITGQCEVLEEQPDEW